MAREGSDLCNLFTEQMGKARAGLIELQPGEGYFTLACFPLPSRDVTFFYIFLEILVHLCLVSEQQEKCQWSLSKGASESAHRQFP